MKLFAQKRFRLFTWFRSSTLCNFNTVKRERRRRIRRGRSSLRKREPPPHENAHLCLQWDDIDDIWFYVATPSPSGGHNSLQRLQSIRGECLQSPRHQLLLAAELFARCCVCVALERRQQRERVGAVYVTHVEMRPLIAP